MPRNGTKFSTGDGALAEGRTNWPKTEDEWFVEPQWVTTWLLQREMFKGAVWDPACGQGNVVKACIERGLMACGSDIKCRGVEGKEWWMGAIDFLRMPSAPWDYNVICNPPYGRALVAEAFIRRACALQHARRVAMFLNSKFLFSERRARGLFRELPPTRVWPVLPRPSCPPGALLRDGLVKAQGGVENYVWMVWDLNKPEGRTEFLWNSPDG
jgi:hypothetical protein